MKVFPSIKKAIGSLNALFNVKPALKLKTILSGLIGNNKIGFSIGQSDFFLAVKQSAALSIFTSANGIGKKETQNTAVAVSTKNTGTIIPEQVPAFNVQQTTYNLTRLVGGNTASLSTTGNQGWTNANRAVSGTNGRANGSNATFSGNALASRNGTILLGYSNQNNKTELTITSVKLKFYYQASGTVLNNGDIQLKWNLGGADFSLATITGNKNSLTTADEFDITASISSWTDLDNLQAKIFCNATALETWTCNLDSIEVEILANKTDVI